MKVKAYNIKWDTTIDGRVQKVKGLPTEVIVDIQAEPDDEDINDLALDAITRTHDWLIDECEFSTIIEPV
jgi:hypothetical protein